MMPARTYRVRGARIRILPAAEEIFQPSQTTLLLARVLEVKPGEVVLDMGAGSGFLAITAALRGAGRVIAADVSEAALDAGKHNAEFNGAADRIEFIRSDRFSALEGRRFDVIVSNPPCSPIPPSLRRRSWPEKRAVDGGPDGIRTSLQIVREAGPFLSGNGRILMPVPKWSRWRALLNEIDRRYVWSVVGRRIVRFWLADKGKPFHKHVIDLARADRADIIIREGEIYSEVLAVEMRLGSKMS